MTIKNTIVTCLIAFSSGTLFAQPVIGRLAPEISLKDIYGVTQKLSDSKGKIVLIDFWASWCMPCRRSNKDILPLYNKYKSKGFEIFAVSLDEKPTDWKSAILADKIKWMQVIEEGRWDGSVATTWGIELLPTTFLLDRDGIIIAINPTKKQILSLIKKPAP
ncbi:MAG: TlpA family protein disulfide reductase [Chitinophagaceae bacterium]